jgi:hypothetical protein
MPAQAEERAQPLLDTSGTWVVCGESRAENLLAEPIVASDRTLFGPRGACLVGTAGPLWVADTGHHRLLGWAKPPTEDNTPADWVIGQPNFHSEGRNAREAGPTRRTLNVPTGIAACGEGLAVADAWNHRVLIWHSPPGASGTPPDLVLGQADFGSGLANRGRNEPAADTLFWPYGVLYDGKRLWVADTGNRRVLMWHELPTRSGQPADLVLGQTEWNCRNENGGTGPTAHSMRWPHALAIWKDRLCVTDAGNSRIMIWQDIPENNNAPCDLVLGQPSFAGTEHNQARYSPDASSLNMPYGVSAAGDWLLVADTANSRLLGWHADDVRMNAPARQLAGQLDFGSKGDNRWQPPQRDSLCWPYAVQAAGNSVVVADSGNNRVSLWQLASGAVTS